jgi:hypothetical protein
LRSQEEIEERLEELKAEVRRYTKKIRGYESLGFIVVVVGLVLYYFDMDEMLIPYLVLLGIFLVVIPLINGAAFMFLGPFGYAWDRSWWSMRKKCVYIIETLSEAARITSRLGGDEKISRLYKRLLADKHFVKRNFFKRLFLLSEVERMRRHEAKIAAYAWTLTASASDGDPLES